MRRSRLCPRCLRTVPETRAFRSCPRCEAAELPLWLRGPEEVRPSVGGGRRGLLERFLVDPWRPPRCPWHPDVEVGLACRCGARLPAALVLGAVPPIGVEVVGDDAEALMDRAWSELARIRPDLAVREVPASPEAPPGMRVGRIEAPDRDRIVVLRAPGSGAVEERFAQWRGGRLVEGIARRGLEEPERGTAVVGSGDGAGGASSAGEALAWLLRADIGRTARRAAR